VFYTSLFPYYSYRIPSVAVDPQDVTGWQVALLLIMSILATTGVRPVQHTVMLFYPQLLPPPLGAGRANYYWTSLSQAIQTREVQSRFWLIRERQHRSDWSESKGARILKHFLDAEKSTFQEELPFQRSESTTGVQQGTLFVF
jgi:hypothetical protein